MEGCVSRQENREGGLGWAGQPSDEAPSYCWAETHSPRFGSAPALLPMRYPALLSISPPTPLPPAGLQAWVPQARDCWVLNVNCAILDTNQGYGPGLPDFLDL